MMKTGGGGIKPKYFGAASGLLYFDTNYGPHLSLTGSTVSIAIPIPIAISISIAILIGW